jgi:hypothetical protein
MDLKHKFIFRAVKDKDICRFTLTLREMGWGNIDWIHLAQDRVQ